MNRFMTTLWVALGTALGGGLRFSADQLVPVGAGLPWATLTVNALGSVLIGWVAGRARDPLSRLARTNLFAFMVPGVCAGLTTFSVFSHQTLILFRTGALSAGLINVAATLALMIAGVILGLKASSWVTLKRD